MTNYASEIIFTRKFAKINPLGFVSSSKFAKLNPREIKFRMKKYSN